ncbi:hypothetical protein PJF56_07380 [Roseofilum sp. BLCC_M91]|uniref:Uncharacterized protein n=1 Tax=Roseofilum halophilum BLCC-M91 TaxID=3022259 RepID=A0ABT7BHM0_9CYAN|nr:hypothetical protein [Roseofilum halophilum]MDJ1178679.1 hypothetical protein [Roseofilum halophilum BLCC-M91]
MGKPFFTLCVPILQAFHGTTLSRNISITVPHNIEKRCIDRLLELSPKEAVSVSMQNSREELLARFSQ